jgi:hypothetical protein
MTDPAPPRSPDSPLTFSSSGAPLSLTPSPAPDTLAAALDSLASTICFSSMDWGRSRDTSWIYGILVGWCEPDDLCCNCDPADTLSEGPCTLDELASTHGWGAEGTARLRQMREGVRAYSAAAERGAGT